MARLPTTLGEVPATTAAPAAPSWASALPSIATAVVQARYQDKVLKTNLARVQAGQQPLDAEAFAPSVRVGIDAGTRRLIGWGIAGALTVAAIGVGLRRRQKARA